MSQFVKNFSLFTDFDSNLFKAGKHFKLYEKMGSHIVTHDGDSGVYFAVWCPNAHTVSVIGNFNHWQPQQHTLYARWDGTGIWEGFIPHLTQGEVYKYHIVSNNNQEVLEKADPFAFMWEVPPRTASVVWTLDYKWKDKKWLTHRPKQNALDKPFSVYEMHIASWRRKHDDNNRSFTYTELADELVQYLKAMHFTHIEFLPVMEHPYGGSWGYQSLGYFAPSSRFGTPQEFMQLIDALHQANIGVILDWVPSHFPADAHGIYRFDGTALYEHQDPRQGYHPDWKSYIFNYGRNEVRSFLISSAAFWCDVYHADALRVDAVASMLYLDYSRKQGEWIPNQYGGRENLEAISLLQEMNQYLYTQYEGIQTIAEESTAFPMISRPVSMGGLGFGMKWMMGWMNDTLQYFKRDPYYRQYHQNEITFSLAYAFTENFMLPFSHDEVVHGKGSLIDRMPADAWQKYANLRLLYGYMFTHPGTKLLFMGCEFAQHQEWNNDGQLNWELTHQPNNSGVQQLVVALNKLYTTEKSLHELQFSAEGFEWIDYNDHQNSVISYVRKGKNKKDLILIVCNFTSIPRQNYRVGVPQGGTYTQVLNTDAAVYAGSDYPTHTQPSTDGIEAHGKPQSLALNLPPLSVIALKLN
jgi:1,4-alpha-glucan branching enzyme